MNHDPSPSTASSEKTQYFDAPIMHFVSDTSNDDNISDSTAGNMLKRNSAAIPDKSGTVLNQPPDGSNGIVNGDFNDGSKPNRLSRSYKPQKQTQQTQQHHMQEQPLNGSTNLNGEATADPDANGETFPKEPRYDRKVSPTLSLRSLPESGGGSPTRHGSGNMYGGGGGLTKRGSIRTSLTGRSIRTSGTVSGATAAFMNGAALTGPNAEPDLDESLHYRAADADRSLSDKQKEKIVKVEKKESKRFSKLLQTEARTEKAALESALSTLSALQALHKSAIKRENKAQSAYAKALSAAQKAESKYLEEKAHAAEERARTEARCIEEKARWAGREAEVNAQNERVEGERMNVTQMEDRVAECAREVERLRITIGTDERERQVKMMSLTGRK
ncbi:hypothetical protein SERLA73DRAFT_191837 [Serpula lacrymans var. lacrymans S7.3]|uniref:Uncharacterized protein n=2 Tax=Serpula lacrymans var. lacrymans TaxID=341189 RepID=F8QIE9_SERL3|nr:uncharacterized protein SERLADRAFT_467807 [Serpula lacrymans var. lacrymans S7.9]EGN91916.1 hypothetical protein SERLA73DRAFT_191837 [Serpula lacrymans var. lacrymans S7.3]EGO24456.1 hypothetical protein SERLADRAFT_467807 [Serpula lacrymans var. lacrymans S7.9]